MDDSRFLPRRARGGMGTAAGVTNFSTWCDAPTSTTLVAGRCAGMTHEGQFAARVSGACFVMGQAAGTAAALALSSGKMPRDLDVSALQAALYSDGAYLGTTL